MQRDITSRDSRSRLGASLLDFRQEVSKRVVQKHLLTTCPDPEHPSASMPRPRAPSRHGLHHPWPFQVPLPVPASSSTFLHQAPEPQANLGVFVAPVAGTRQRFSVDPVDRNAVPGPAWFRRSPNSMGLKGETVRNSTLILCECEISNSAGTQPFVRRALRRRTARRCAVFLSLHM